MKLIDKDTLATSIKKLKMDIGNIFNEYDEGFWEGRTTAFDDVICAISNLEVKEVNLEEELKNLIGNVGQCDRRLAKHFYELGLKAQKGE